MILKNLANGGLVKVTDEYGEKLLESGTYEAYPKKTTRKPAAKPVADKE